MTSDSPFCLWVVDSFVNGFSTWTHQTAAMKWELPCIPRAITTSSRVDPTNKTLSMLLIALWVWRWMRTKLGAHLWHAILRRSRQPVNTSRLVPCTRFQGKSPELLFLFENVFYSNANVPCPQDVFFDCVWSHRHFIAYFLKSIGHACSYLDRRPWITAQEWVFTAPKGDLPRSLRRLHHIFPTRPVATGVALGVATAVGVEPSRCSGYRSISKPCFATCKSKVNHLWLVVWTIAFIFSIYI